MCAAQSALNRQVIAIFVSILALHNSARLELHHTTSAAVPSARRDN